MNAPDTIEQWLRLVLLLSCFFGVVYWLPFVRILWPERQWSIRVVFIGLGGTHLYLLIGQGKAYGLGIPFDWVAWIGLGFTLTTLAGMVQTIAHANREKG